MKKLLLLFPLTFLFLMALPTEDAEAYWGYRTYEHSRQIFKPRFSLTLSGGLHFVDFYGDGSNGFTYGLVEAGGHLWVHPNISIDLNVGGHLTANNWTGKGWGYVSIKPGVRFRFGIFYLRTALDLGFGAPQVSPSYAARISNDTTLFLFGVLLGAGLRIPVSRHVRIFGELTYQFNFMPDPLYMPFYGQLGVEVVF
ncbi:MAG: hypothetical protein H6727_12025 [Myxococcales bacterium]|nr:hypothetical protein [Myxococcales bacterium]